VSAESVNKCVQYVASRVKDFSSLTWYMQVYMRLLVMIVAYDEAWVVVC
jgi:hypothetical protein